MTIARNRQPTAAHHCHIEPTGRMTKHPTDPQGIMMTYNMFRHKDEADLYCAVPQDRPVPAFLTEDKWSYARALDIRTLSGFDTVAANTSAKVNDFYLFQSNSSPRLPLL